MAIHVLLFHFKVVYWLGEMQTWTRIERLIPWNPMHLCSGSQLLSVHGEPCLILFFFFLFLNPTSLSISGAFWLIYKCHSMHLFKENIYNYLMVVDMAEGWQGWVQVILNRYRVSFGWLKKSSKDRNQWRVYISMNVITKYLKIYYA